MASTPSDKPGARDSLPAPGRPTPSVPPDGVSERRSYDRIPVAEWAVDYSSGETFLYSYIQNISAMGIFVYSREPLPRGATLKLRFQPPGEAPFDLEGEVAWVNPYREGGENLNPGMGVRFVNLDAETRERLVELVKTIAYLPDTQS